MQNTIERGNDGEKIAEKYLQDLGYKIIKRKFHFGKVGEIDLIAKDGETIVFVEVKARKSSDYGSGFEAITPTKQKHLINVARGFLYVNELNDAFTRFDAISINLSKSPPEIEHLKNIITIM
ncbi:MAG TPA: YraN family protein [Bacteroidota bacterium]|nr:YraN family protein [Candidatus Kapabacteria bacterium]HRS02133.1 YraN family protein [Bacteroidota bacterium]